MIDSKTRDFDVGKWSKKNSDLAKKAYENWKKENVEKPSEGKKEPSNSK